MTLLHLCRRPQKVVKKSICLLLLLGLLPVTSFAEAVLSENEAKAALLYNFIKHTQWPNENATREFTVLFVGTDKSFYNEFSSIAAEITVRGKKVTASQITKFDRLDTANVLVISSSLNKQLPDIAAALTRTETLLISDGATDKKIVMINYVPHQQAISFEINKSNIVYDGLKISNDVLLHGGSEIEVATLYKEMEFLLRNIKNEVEQSKAALQAKVTEIDKKNQEIIALKEQAATITQLLTTQNTQISEQQAKLLELDKELNNIKTNLDSSQQLLDQREKLVSDLEIEISRNKNTLKQQQEQIALQEQLVAEKAKTVSRQGDTISSQRNIIFVAMALLLIFLLLIITRQKQALSRERQLVETKAALIAAQEEAIKAYESSDQLKNDFLTAISHEMRTPMNGIIGAVQIANTDDLPSLQASMNIIAQSSDNMINLVDDILTYIEIQSEQMEMLTEPVNIRQLFDSLRQQYSKACQEKSLQLNWHITDNIAPWLITDKNKLSKVLQKLLDNALKFTHNGAITMIVRYQAGSDGKGNMICTIKDTGTGIPTEDQQYIFDPFWQQESGLTRRFNGLGIGLTICKKLVQLMGGSIDMDSTDGQGTQFTVTLPVTETQMPIQASSPQQKSGNALPILVVEDNIINQHVLQLMLNKLGYHVLIASDGCEALDIIDRHTPSIILMDLQMPNMDGLTCTRAIRQRQDELKKIPIIAITANLMESQQAQCLEAGMNDYIGKPIELTRLRSTLQEFIP